MTERAERIKAELEYIASQHGGLLDPAHVVEFAQDEATELHSQFQWDDTKAAEQYRISQARQLIRLVVIHPDSGQTISIRAWVSLEDDRGRGGYRRIQEVVSDEDLMRQYRLAAILELNRVKAKYQLVEELAGIFAEIDRLNEQHAGRSAKADDQPAAP